MITKLVLKSSSNNKTSKLTLCRSNGDSVRQAARHAQVAPGSYVFVRAFDVHPSHPEVRGLIGKTVLMFRRTGSTDKVYLYAGPSNMIPVQSAIAVSTSDFQEIWAGAHGLRTTLEVKSAFMLWGTSSMREEAIPPSYRHLFTVPLDQFAEMSEQAKREEARRRAEELARENAAAQARAAAARHAAEVERARQQASVKAQPRPAPPKPRSSGLSRPAQSTVRRGTTGPASRSLYNNQTTYDDSDSLGDFMFMSMFPDVAPLYRPNSFLAWYLWSQNQHDGHTHQFTGSGGQFDGGGASGNWQQGVPGFPDAASQRVTPYGDGHRVELLDANGRNVGAFTVTENNGQTQFTAPGGHVFTVAGQGTPSIEYTSEGGQRFYWDGASEPVVGSAQDNDNMAAPAAAVQSFFDTGSSQDSSNTMGFSTFETRDAPQSMASTTAY